MAFVSQAMPNRREQGDLGEMEETGSGKLWPVQEIRVLPHALREQKP
jgi:hypothetical protein